jgi:signal transduction histidine kinase
MDQGLMADSIANDVAIVQRIEVIPRILEVVCRTTGMGFAAVARVTSERWVACAVRDDIDFGLQPGGELEVATTICDEIRASGEPVLIEHVAEDPAFRQHPTPLQYGFQSYVSVPIICRGEFFGTLCAIDPSPHAVRTAEVRAMFELYAELIAFHLEAQRRVEISEKALFDERETAELRDQFIAVLGHDLRNPLASIDGAARLLRKTALDERAEALVGMMQASVRRMAGLIDNVMDFARGQLGGGFDITAREELRLADGLSHVIDEFRATYPERRIEVDFQLEHAVIGDARRLGQLLSSLVGNALSHGAADAPVLVGAATDPEGFELWVSNSGPPIPPEAMARLFLPFSRASVRPNQDGLGLGLYIASEIARAHGGTLDATSNTQETRFTFRMPTVVQGQIATAVAVQS